MLSLHRIVTLSCCHHACNIVSIMYIWRGRCSCHTNFCIIVLHILLVQLGKTALHDAAIKGNAEMVSYMMEQVNPNVDARDMVGGNDCTVWWL